MGFLKTPIASTQRDGGDNEQNNNNNNETVHGIFREKAKWKRKAKRVLHGISLAVEKCQERSEFFRGDSSVLTSGLRRNPSSVDREQGSFWRSPSLENRRPPRCGVITDTRRRTHSAMG